MSNPINRLSVYDYAIIFLLALFVINSTTQGLWPTAHAFVLTSVLIAAFLDLSLAWAKSKVKKQGKGRTPFTRKVPKSGIVSGLIIGLLIEPSVISIQSILPVILASALAILLKNLVRIKGDHIFNPANLGLLITVLLFSTGPLSWWGANPPWLVILFGLFLAYRLKRLNPAISFLAAYFILFIGLDAATGRLSVNTLTQFHNGTLLFFAFIMVQEPITAPRSSKGRLLFGPLVAVLSFALTFYFQQYSLLLALVIADVFVPLFNWKT